ncbi:ABC transporter ATP-binding protein [Oleisolibacter albus]|uniref:ABC transporter ATP-binding protein n=1 Tax=Oleisolibacter albus TaxID=2171757 RepID=UPI000DF2DBD4|nr:ABC transporter ATP-binding protein [Oleisolibacter albus]
MLEIEGLVCRRGDAGRGFHLEVPRLHIAAGEAVAVTGPSGCGKSTLLDVLGLVLRPGQADRFVLGGPDRAVDIRALWQGGGADPMAGLRARAIGYILQTGGLLPFLTVRDNIALSLRLLGQRADAPHLPALVETLGLTPLLDKRPAALSVGERQRVAIARALAHRPALLLADEPTASVDPDTAGRIVTLLLEAVRALGTTLVLVSHDWDMLDRLPLRRLRAEPVAGAAVPTTRFGGTG